MARTADCSGCDWFTCIGCPHNDESPLDPWEDADYPEYDPAEDYDPMGYPVDDD